MTTDDRETHRQIARQIIGGTPGNPGTIPGEQGPGREIAFILEALVHATLANSPAIPPAIPPPPAGRSYLADVTGDSPPELEVAALNQAREFFGDDVALKVSPSYCVGRHRGGGYRGSVMVREVVPSEPPDAEIEDGEATIFHHDEDDAAHWTPPPARGDR